MKKINFTNFTFCFLMLFAFQAQAQYNGVAYQGNTPQVGAVIGVPVKIELENYDALSSDPNGDGANFSDDTDDIPPAVGGVTGTYNDKSAGGASGGNSIRTGSDVDFKTGGTGHVLTSVQGSEYVIYTINVVQAGTYNLGVNYAHGGSSKDIKVYSHATDGTGKTSLYSSLSAGGIPATGNSNTYVTNTLGSFTLPAGPLLIRFRILDTGPNFDFFTLTLAGDDYNGVAYQNNIPQVGTTVGATTTIEFENYDALSTDPTDDGYNYNDPTNDLIPGVTGTYYDESPGGHSGGNTARATSDVDIKSAGSGDVVTDVKPNEYIVYTINVVTAGNYELGMNYSHGGSSKDIEVYSHATDATGKTLLYDSGGAGIPQSSYATTTLGTFDLPAGPLLIRIRFLDTGPSFDFFTLKLLTALPVELTRFNAKSTTEGNLLEWETATEEQNKGFDVERSIDGKHWETLDFVEGNGTTFEAQNYTYTDNAPLNGMNYYRLKQMDMDGQFEYTEVVSVELGIENQTTISIYPNPVQNELTISEGIGNITIFNALGQPIHQLTNNESLTTINTSNLSKGVYFLRLEKTNGVFVTRQFIK